MRERIFEIIETGRDKDGLSKVYDFFMMAVIIISLMPLVFKSDAQILHIIDYVTVCIFIIDYILRFITADFKIQKGKKSFLLYPISFMAIIDLITILPAFFVLNPGLKVLKIFRLIRTFKVFRIFKGFRYFKYFNLIASVVKNNVTVY